MNKKFELSKLNTNRTIEDILINGLFMDGGWHKQWYIEQALIKLGFDINKYYEKCLQDEEYGGWEIGIAP